jgi:hypothetical protein
MLISSDREADMAWRIQMRWLGAVAGIALLAACSDPAPSTDSAQASSAAPPSDAGAPVIEVTEASFRCIRNMTPVRGFFVDNLLGDVEATVAVAESATGETYPPGSLVQVIPTTAMVKHQPGHNPATNDWEFMELAVTADGTTILGRGFADLNMRSGANCFTCHQPAKADWDLICEQTHGCIPIPLTPAMLRGIQNTDPRCPAIELPQEQIDALAALAATRAPPAPATPPER